MNTSATSSLQTADLNLASATPAKKLYDILNNSLSDVTSEPDHLVELDTIRKHIEDEVAQFSHPPLDQESLPTLVTKNTLEVEKKTLFQIKASLAKITPLQFRGNTQLQHLKGTAEALLKKSEEAFKGRQVMTTRMKQLSLLTQIFNTKLELALASHDKGKVEGKEEQELKKKLQDQEKELLKVATQKKELRREGLENKSPTTIMESFSSDLEKLPSKNLLSLDEEEELEQVLQQKLQNWRNVPGDDLGDGIWREVASRPATPPPSSN